MNIDKASRNNELIKSGLKLDFFNIEKAPCPLIISNQELSELWITLPIKMNRVGKEQEIICINQIEIEASPIEKNFLDLKDSKKPVITPLIIAKGIENFKMRGKVIVWGSIIIHIRVAPKVIEIGVIIVIDSVIGVSKWNILSGWLFKINFVEILAIRRE